MPNYRWLECSKHFILRVEVVLEEPLIRSVCLRPSPLVRCLVEIDWDHMRVVNRAYEKIESVLCAQALNNVERGWPYPFRLETDQQLYLGRVSVPETCSFEVEIVKQLYEACFRVICFLWYKHISSR